MPKSVVTELNSDQRLNQLATILAQGVIRFQLQNRRTGSRPTKKSKNSTGRGLEVFGETRLSVSRRV